MAAIEERVFRIPPGRHILGVALLSFCWFVFLRHQWRNAVGPVVFVTQTVSRAAAIAIAWVSRPAKEGMGLARKLTTVSAAIAIACGCFAALTWGIRSATLMLLACFLIIRLVREQYYRRLGGITPTALSITQRMTELSTLLVATFVQSLWHTT
jgi:cobalamin synthase